METKNYILRLYNSMLDRRLPTRQPMRVPYLFIRQLPMCSGIRPMPPHDLDCKTLGIFMDD